MRNNSKKTIKNDVIRVRVSGQEKEQYTTEAKELGMNLSQYVTFLLRHKTINHLEYGRELVKEVYRLNQNLNNFVMCENVPEQEIRTTTTRGLKAILTQVKEIEQGDKICQS